jgi:hypothetical protein
VSYGKTGVFWGGGGVLVAHQLERLFEKQQEGRAGLAIQTWQIDLSMESLLHALFLPARIFVSLFDHVRCIDTRLDNGWGGGRFE